MSDMAEVVSKGKSSDMEKFEYTKEEDGVRRTVRGEQVENGWIVTISKDWEEKLPNGSSEYKYNSWKYISGKDPREILKDAQKGKPVVNASEATNILNSVAQAQGMLIVG